MTGSQHKLFEPFWQSKRSSMVVWARPASVRSFTTSIQSGAKLWERKIMPSKSAWLDRFKTCADKLSRSKHLTRVSWWTRYNDQRKNWPSLTNSSITRRFWQKVQVVNLTLKARVETCKSWKTRWSSSRLSICRSGCLSLKMTTSSQDWMRCWMKRRAILPRHSTRLLFRVANRYTNNVQVSLL